jgi:cytochrome P450
VLDVPAAKEIHSVKATYAKAPWYRTFATPGTENVFSTTDIEFHRRHRRLLQGPLSETNLKVFHPVVEQRVELAIQRMKEETSTRGATDILKWFLFLATDTVGELTFGESFRTLESGEVGLIYAPSKYPLTCLTINRKTNIPKT